MKRLILWVFACSLLMIPFSSRAEETSQAVFRALQEEKYGEIRQQMDDAMKAAISEQALAALLPQLEAAGGAYAGQLEEETTQQAGYTIQILHLVYERRGFAFRTVWKEGKLAGMQILPESLPALGEALPGSLTEEAVSLGDPSLPGTLTLPAQPAGAPLPAAILVHGSGPNDRDETVGQTKLFRDLAWGLAQKGIAVLRYDKRTLVYASQLAAQDLTRFTLREETMDDALAAAQWLAADARIDSGRIVLIGHSLGAMAAPRIAAENPGVFSKLILLSGSPLTLTDIMIHQNQAAADAAPEAEKPALQAMTDDLGEQAARLLAGTEKEAAAMTLLGQPAYYFWEMAQHDTGEILRSLPLPALIINGGSDFQVPDADGIDAWRALDLPDTVQLLHKEALNHLLMAPDAPEDVRGTVQEYEIPCRADEAVLEEIAAFILH